MLTPTAKYDTIALTVDNSKKKEESKRMMRLRHVSQVELMTSHGRFRCDRDDLHSVDPPHQSTHLGRRAGSARLMQQTSRARRWVKRIKRRRNALRDDVSVALERRAAHEWSSVERFGASRREVTTSRLFVDTSVAALTSEGGNGRSLSRSCDEARRQVIVVIHRLVLRVVRVAVATVWRWREAQCGLDDVIEWVVIFVVWRRVSTTDAENTVSCHSWKVYFKYLKYMYLYLVTQKDEPPERSQANLEIHSCSQLYKCVPVFYSYFHCPSI